MAGGGLRCAAWREGDMWVSICLELGITSCGTTLKEARENLHEAISLYIQEARTLRKQGKRIAMRPVPWYFIKARLFDIRYGLRRLRHKRISQDYWVARDVNWAYAF